RTAARRPSSPPAPGHRHHAAAAPVPAICRRQSRRPRTTTASVLPAAGRALGNSGESRSRANFLPAQERLAYPKAWPRPIPSQRFPGHADAMHIRDWPTAERPREKLLAHGASILSDAELLAIFLGSGLRGRDAVQT